MSRFRLLLTLQAFAFISLAWAQDVVSGPDQGKPVPPLKVFDATGPNQGKEVDFAAERKAKPTVFVVIHANKWDRPMARFLRKLDETLKKDEDAGVVAVWLTETPDKTKEYLPLAQQSLKFEKTILTCFIGGRAGPQDWNINSDAHLTVVIANKGKVTSVLGYRSINDTDVPAVREAYQKAVKR